MKCKQEQNRKHSVAKNFKNIIQLLQINEKRTR